MRTLVRALERRNKKRIEKRRNKTTYVSLGHQNEPWKNGIVYACFVSIMVLMSLFMCGHIQLG
jgi:hypothetical protein